MKRIPKANALAALGAFQFRARHNITPTVTAKEIKAEVGDVVSSGEVRVRLNPSVLEEIDNTTNLIKGLSIAWTDTLEKTPPPKGGIRLGIEAFASPKMILLKDRLSRAAGVATVFVADRSLNPQIDWSWPLRIGFLPDKESQQLCNLLISSYYHQHLLEPVTIGEQTDSCDILIVSSMEKLAMALPWNHAGIAILLSNEPELPSFPQLRIQIRNFNLATMILIPNAFKLDLPFIFHNFFDQLSHDQTIDRSLTIALGDTHNHLTISHPTFINDFRVSRFPLELKRQLNRAFLRGHLGDEEYTMGMMNINDMQDIGAYHGFDSETTGATVTSDQMRRLDPLLDKIEDRTSIRYLQAQIYEHRSSELLQRRFTFRSGTKHRLKIRLGPGSIDWIQVDNPLPEHELDGRERYHLLEILLISSDFEEGPTCLTVKLPKNKGPSEEANFDVTVAADSLSVDATVLVLYKNRPIQSARIFGLVSEAPEEVPAVLKITMQLHEPACVDLSITPEVDLMLHRTSDAVTCKPAGRQEWICPNSGIDDLAGKLKCFIVDAMTHTGPPLVDTGSSAIEGLMLKLATHGGLLRSRMFGTHIDLESVHSVHVTGDASSDYIPVEFFYDGPPPDAVNAHMCRKFGKTGSCKNKCDIWRAYGGTPVPTICPLAFWGLKRSIERQIRPFRLLGNARRPGAPETRRQRETLPKIDKIIFAATDRINAIDPSNAVEKTAALIGKLVKPGLIKVDSWKEWQDQIVKHVPPLLLAITHNEKNRAEMQALEIGTGDQLPLNLVSTSHVCPPDSAQHPIVLLLGCETAASGIGFEDWIAAFRRSGAAIVVGTLTTVFGRHAAPVAVEFVRQLQEASRLRSIRFGDLMRTVRHRMLYEGNIMGLVLLAFGDASWKLPKR